MSQKTIFIVLIAIILAVNQADSKRKRQEDSKEHSDFESLIRMKPIPSHYY